MRVSVSHWIRSKQGMTFAATRHIAKIFVIALLMLAIGTVLFVAS